MTVYMGAVKDMHGAKMLIKVGRFSALSVTSISLRLVYRTSIMMSKMCGYTDSGQKFEHCIIWVRFKLLDSEAEQRFSRQSGKYIDNVVWFLRFYNFNDTLDKQMLGGTLDMLYGPPADQRDHTTFISVLSNAYLKKYKNHMHSSRS